MREMSEGKKISINILYSVASFLVTIVISLFITPLIVEEMGSEAYGFVGLANSFVSYASLVTVALNSMSSRFVSIEIYKKDYEEASRYFTSVFFANLVIAAIMLPIMVFFVWNIQIFLNIPTDLLADVKLAFAIVFAQFVINVLLSHFEIAAFVTNRLYLSQRNSIISAVVRLLVVISGFALIGTKISILTLGSFIGTIYIYAMNLHYTKRFIPELRIRKQYFDVKYIKKLIAAGVWNLVNKLSSILLDGLDLLITNLFIGSLEMGALSLSKTIPAMFLTLRGTLDYPFTPPMTKCYAEGDIDGVVKYARMGNKVLGIFMIAPMATFAVYGLDFFKLWVPSQDSLMIQILSLLSIASLLAGACINSVHTIFTITNNLKVNSLVILLTGIATVLTNFALLKTTNWGVYIIAGVSSFYSFLRNFIFTPLYGAHCLKVKKRTFYHEIMTGLLCLALNILVGVILRSFLMSTTWISFVASCAIMVCICLVINFRVVLNKSERSQAIAAVRSKLKGAMGR